MKEIIFYAICYYCGLVSFVRRWIRRPGHRLIILNYHSAAGGDMRRHMLYLQRYYRVLPLEEALEELYATGKPKERISDRRIPLVLTFDDGYRDNYTHAFPLARELHVPITIFLNPGYIESRNNNCSWWQAGDYLVEHAQVDEAVIEGYTYHLDRPEERETLARAIYTRARNARSVAEREAFLAEVRDALAIPSIVPTEKEAILSWEEIIEMERSGWVSFGGHTMHHPVLAYLESPTEVRTEVSECRTIVEQHLGHPVRTFAYPIGKVEHIGKEALKAVREAGYDWAVTTIFGINNSESDPLQLRRIEVDVRQHWLLLAAATTGIRQFFHPMITYGNGLLLAGRKRARSLLSSFISVRAVDTRQSAMSKSLDEFQDTDRQSDPRDDRTTRSFPQGTARGTTLAERDV